MRILNVIFDSRLGGPQLRIVNVASYLKRKYNIVTIVIIPEKRSQDLKSILLKNSIKYHSLKLCKLSENFLDLIKWAIFFIPEVLKLKKIIKKENPDIVHCNSSWQWKGIIAARLAGTKIVWHLNDTKIYWLIRVIFKFLSKKVDGFIVEGRNVKNYYLKETNIKKNVFEIQAPVDTEKFNPEEVEVKNFFKDHKGFKILTVGNINTYKGIEYLIEAAHILNEKYENISFFIIGHLFKTQKKYIQKLKNKIHKYQMENFYLYGPSENIPSILKTSDIYVCASVSEASPQSVWEAMAMKKPVVSTDVGSVSDFIKDGESGMIVPIKSPESLADRIAYLINNPEKRKMFGIKAREIAVNHLDIKICAEKHLEIYNKIIDYCF